MSVPNTSEVQATFAATLVDEWIRHGLRDVVVCPGSRSTPMALAFAQRPELRHHIRLDERGAGFFAIGRALATQRPVAVVVTSGTASAELHAAVAEADQAYVPLLVITADRPPELHGVGAAQTIPQTELFGVMVRVFEEPGVPEWATRQSWRALASRLWCGAEGWNGRVGPVHLNVAFREPLLGVVQALPDARPDAQAWNVRLDQDAPVRVPVEGQKVLVVAGPGTNPDDLERARAMRWAVVGDATQPGTLSYVDGLLRDEAFAEWIRPDVVIRIGGLVASKVLAQTLQRWGVPVLGLDLGRPVADPDRLVHRTLHGTQLAHVDADVRDGSYVEQWSRVIARADQQFVGLSFENGALTEASIARTVVSVANDTMWPLVLGSSMPIREVEWFCEPRRTSTYANRGANGIDGVVSTVFGVGVESGAVGLVGDLTFLHDVSALVDAPATSVALVVVANGGGHIFDFLPQKAALDEGLFTDLFTTPRPLSPAAVAAGFGLSSSVVSSVGELRSALANARGRHSVTVIEARPSAPVSNVDFHAWLERSLARVSSEVRAS